MRIVVSEDARDFQRRNWSALVHEDPAGTFFHQPSYLKLYWEEFGETPEHLLLVFGETDAGEQVAAVAFERSGETLRFLGGTEITDYLGPVARTGAKPAFAAALWNTLAARDDWATADLWGIAENSGWYELLADAAVANGHSVQEAPDHDGVSPFLSLAPTWEGYLEGLPSKMRHEIKRKSNKLEVEAGPVRIVVAGTEDLVPLLDRFVELHRMSDGPKGVFMVPGMEIFFRRLGETFLSAGGFRLNFIEVGGQLAAGTIGFRWTDRFFLYNSAFDRSWGSLAPGMVLVGEDIRLAIEDGATGFDMLKGDYAYKYRFGAVARPVRRMIVRRERG
ncbi:MAG TPA: GNAT family N-acetyltransferase [Actinomycetota bacterium]|nr:GNAT family N-acetyltransferase [Actinomycetota bacterium]